MYFSFQEAKYHMQRCIDSGLWVPNARGAEGAEKTEGIYEELKKDICEEDKGNPWMSSQTFVKQIVTLSLCCFISFTPNSLAMMCFTQLDTSQVVRAAF